MTTPVLPLLDKISQTSTRTKKFRVLQSQFGDGYMQRAPDGINNTVEQWVVTYNNLVSSDRDTVQTFLSLVGLWTWFTATMPGDTTEKKWRVDTNPTESTSGAIFNISFTIIQVFDLI